MSPTMPTLSPSHATASHAAGLHYDLLTPYLYLDPHPLLRKMREEAPVYFSPELDAWVLTRYADVDATLNDPRVSVVEAVKRLDALPPSMRQQLMPLRTSFETWMGRGDVQQHDRFQSLLRRHFTPAVAGTLLPGISRIVNELLSSGISGGEIDIVNDIAHPMAMRVVTELALDMPSTHLDMLIRRSKDISGLLEMGEPAQLLRCQDAVLELTDYLHDVISCHGSEGRGGINGVLLDALSKGLLGSIEEVIGNIIMFLVVGYHTTANLLCNGLQLLFEHPQQREQLTRDFSLCGTAIDEMMRFHGPVASVRRMAMCSFNLRGASIRGGQTLLLVLAAANRDPAVYANPDHFDIGRTPNRHVGFTVGPYACMGKALARLEAMTFFPTVLNRLPSIRPRDARPDWVAFRPLGHELRTLRVLFDSVTSAAAPVALPWEAE